MTHAGGPNSFGCDVTPEGEGLIDSGGAFTCRKEGCGGLLELSAGQGLLIVKDAGIEERAGPVTLLQRRSLW